MKTSLKRSNFQMTVLRLSIRVLLTKLFKKHVLEAKKEQFRFIVLCHEFKMPNEGIHFPGSIKVKFFCWTEKYEYCLIMILMMTRFYFFYLVHFISPIPDLLICKSYLISTLPANDIGSTILEINVVCWQILENIEAIKSKSIEKHSKNITVSLTRVSCQPFYEARSNGAVQVYEIKWRQFYIK